MLTNLADSNSFDLAREPLTVSAPRIPVDDSLIPRFHISAAEKNIGYISRGHALLFPEHRGQGYFDSALAQLEAFERGLFEDGKFPAYRRSILQAMGLGASFLESTLRKLSEPHHIDFWRLPEVAAYFLDRGYQLDRWTAEYLYCKGLPRSASTEDTAHFLRLNHLALKGQLLCVLTKPIGHNQATLRDDKILELTVAREGGELRFQVMMEKV